MSVVLDASALLAYLHQETVWEIVRASIAASFIGSVNWCEVAQKIKRKGLAIDKARTFLDELGLKSTPFSVGQAEQATHLWESTRNLGLSLADRACLALAIEQNAPVLTADRALIELNLPIDIQVVR